MSFLLTITVVMLIVWYYQLKREKTQSLRKFEMQAQAVRTEIAILFGLFAIVAVWELLQGII